MGKFPNIFKESMYLGKIPVKNRLVMAPTVRCFATPDGYPTQRSVETYRTTAKGGVGLIIHEATAIHPYGIGFPNAACFFDDSYIPRYKLITDAIHAEACPTIIQFFHVGRQGAHMPEAGGVPNVAPSPIQQYDNVPWDPLAKFPYCSTPRELTTAEIEEIRDFFIEATVRAKKAGFDGVEYHSAHGYLLHEFLSPAVNKREDKYGPGTDVENRTRLHREIIEGVRARLGDYPTEFRIDGSEFYEHVTGITMGPYIYGVTSDKQRQEGIKIKDAVETAIRLAKAGADGFHVSGGCYGACYYQLPPMDTPTATHLEAGIAVKKGLIEAGYDKVPVTTVGRINRPAIAEKILSETPIDFVALSRPLLADPYYPAKAMAGQEGLIRTCIACNQGCTDYLLKMGGIECIYNVLLGRDGRPEFTITRTKVPKKVLVVGGGPGGMSAAEVAAMKGHDVTLCEKTSKLGGQVRLNANVPFRGEWASMIRYYENMLKHLGVKINLNTEVTSAYVEKMNPDVVIVATGALPGKLGVKGEDLPHVTHYLDVLSGEAKVGKEVAIIGWLSPTAYTADFLKDKTVTIINPRGFADFCQDIALTFATHQPIKHRIFNLRKPPVELINDAQVNEITKTGVKIVAEGKEKLVPCDTVVIAAGGEHRGVVRNNALFKELKTKFPELPIFAVGDCRGVRENYGAYRAIHTAFETANTV